MTESNPQIYIKGFSKTTRQKDLQALFQKYGKIKQARIVNAYAFIGFDNQESVKQAVKQMNDYQLQGNKLKVEVAGRPKKQKGPQPTDSCRYCNKLGHWKNSCPQYRRSSRRRYRSSSSQSSSSSSDRRKKKRRSRRRSPSSSSNSSNSSSSSSSKSRDKRKKVRKQKHQNSKKEQ